MRAERRPARGLPLGGARPDGRLPATVERRRPRPRRRRALGPARHPRRPAGQRVDDDAAARRPGCLRARPAGRLARIRPGRRSSPSPAHPRSRAGCGRSGHTGSATSPTASCSAVVALHGVHGRHSARATCLGGGVTRTVEVDYLVVGAGASGMAFTDALIDHADVRVALVDRRPGVGGHWREAYPFVRLHQASTFYGVASTVLGGGRIQADGPGGGAARAGRPADDLRLLRRGAGPDAGVGARASSSPGATTSATARSPRLTSGERFEVPERCRVVDARYLSPTSRPRRRRGSGSATEPG